MKIVNVLRRMQTSSERCIKSEEVGKIEILPKTTIIDNGLGNCSTRLNVLHEGEAIEKIEHYQSSIIS